MARNAEKAMTTLARWRAAHIDGEKQQQRRPFLASECNDLQQANKWRLQIIREIARKVSQIQNAGLGEFRIRDLNDEINKLIREKGHWEAQIRELGGADYAAVGPRMLDNEGKEVPGNRGYKYFGAARQLPGVRELFEKAAPPPAKKTRGELIKYVDADYYGYRDDDDGVLAKVEGQKEADAIAKEVKTWREKHGVDDDDVKNDSKRMSVRDEFIGYVPVPSQKDIEQALLDKRKAELLQRIESGGGSESDSESEESEKETEMEDD